jgi:hypothetical protein
MSIESSVFSHSLPVELSYSDIFRFTFDVLSQKRERKGYSVRRVEERGREGERVLL